MTKSAVVATGLAKQYQLGQGDASYQTLREAIVKAVRWPFRARVEDEAGAQSQFWALQDVNFELGVGKVLGVIGRNGAGKSTLLKLLSRITEPTRGKIEINGRVACLLEVGTGFHPELTGRENIFLNGAILGMKRAEIRRKFDEIVAFAEVEKFLDTPVKRYSSGMYVRLAFAVAANLEPEILLVDEVLAVGDVEFQKKCLNRMRGLAKSDITIVFVSHNMAAIHALCDSCLLLEQGRSIAFGPTNDVIEKYLQHHGSTKSYVQPCPVLHRPCVLEAQLALSERDKSQPGAVIQVTLRMHAPERSRIALWFRLKDRLSMPVAFASVGELNAAEMVTVGPGESTFTIQFPVHMLAVGDYSIHLSTVVPGVQFIEDIDDCLRFTLERSPQAGAVRALEQSWGYGCIELPARRVETVVPIRGDHIATA